MITCLIKRCLFALLNVYHFVFVFLLLLVFEGGIWDLIVLTY